MIPLFTLAISFFSIHNAYAQAALSINGKVMDEEGEGLPGAIIEVHELHRYTTTDLEGNYAIENLKRGTYHLHVTFIGFEGSDRTVRLTVVDRKEDFYLHPSSLELKELIVEANPFKSGPMEQSITVETVNREFIDRNLGNTFINSLEKLPGVTSINTGVGISKPVIRGLSFNRIIVNDRGVKQEGQQWGSDHGLEIDQFDPQRIEIIKGPSSLIFGSDGMGGVINIRAPAFARENTTKGEITGLFRSNNNLWGSSAYVNGNRNGFVFSGRFSILDFADYKVPAESSIYNTQVIPIADGKLKNTAGQERNFTLMCGLIRNWGHSTLSLSSFNQKIGMYPGAIAVPGEYSVTPDGNSRNIDLPRQLVNHLKIVSNTNIQLGDNWLESDIGYQFNNRKEESVPHAHGQQENTDPLAMHLKLHTLSANIRYHHNWEGAFSSIWGIQGQLQMNNRAGFEYLLPDFRNGNIGIYNYTERPVGTKATINAGLRFDQGTVHANGYSHSADWVRQYGNGTADNIVRGTEFQRNFSNVSAAMGISYYPTHAINTKLNLGKSFKIPSYAELASNGIHHGTFRHEVGDSTLSSEHGYQVDMNLNYHRNHFHLTFTPFFYYFDSFIYLSPSASFVNTDAKGVRYSLPEGGQVYRYRQNDAVFTGAEISLDYHVWKDLHLLVAGEYVWNKNLESRLPLPFTPPLSLLGEIEYTLPWRNESFPKSFAGFQARIVGAQERVERNERTTPAYTLFHFNAGTEIKLGSRSLELLLRVENLANREYFNHLSRYRLLNLPEQGRNASIMIKIPLGKE